MKKGPVPLILVAILAFVAGCSSPTQRAEELGADFQQLKPEIRKAALDGEILEGMGPDAVYVAFGSPDRIRRGVERGVTREYWIYSRLVREPIHNYREIYHTTASGAVIPLRTYDPFYLTHVRESFEIIFEKGKVIGWRML
jgi:hypothetical protein